MNEILLPVLIVAGIGLLCGLGLAIASIVMAVPKDEKAEAIEEILPGANCGACGYSGCAGYAKALSSGEAPVGLCSPGGAAVAAATAELLGVAAGEVEYKTALVHCMGSHDNTTDRMKYQGIGSCAQLVVGRLSRKWSRSLLFLSNSLFFFSFLCYHRCVCPVGRACHLFSTTL